MLTWKRFALVLALMAAASPALAGTKFATNIVPSSAFNPAPNPTLSAKGQIKLSDKGQVQVSLAGVTDAGGLPVTTSTTYNDAVSSGAPPALDGTEYIVIIKAFMPGVGFIPSIEVPIPVDLKNGKGKTKLALGDLFALLGANLGRAFEVRGVEVWGPLGAAAAADCQAIVAGAIPAGIPLAAGVCRGADGGVMIGMSGLSIPVPEAP